MIETNERVTVDFDSQSYYLDGEYWESWDNYGEEMADKINELLNESAEENKLHKERISLLSSLLDLADAIIDTSDNEKAKQVWDNKNEQTEKEWERILNDQE